MMSQIPLSASLRADNPEADASRNDGTHEVAADIAYRRLAIVNVVFLGLPGAGDRGWVLIDAGVHGAGSLIISAAEERFEKGARPSAIVMTHGHFDHVGALQSLAEAWDVPVYAHALERPYLDGTASYPPPDPSVGGGLIARLSPLFPTGPVDVGERLVTLPSDGSIPPMPGWRWIPTPGHTVGHVSFWREADRSLIVGDAFVTTKQESAYAAMVQEPEMHGPPMYFTPDWQASQASVERLAALEPELVITGHGRPMHGEGMRSALRQLARDFEAVAVPERGKYRDNPVRVEDGRAYRDP